MADKNQQWGGVQVGQKQSATGAGQASTADPVKTAFEALLNDLKLLKLPTPGATKALEDWK
jgi:hypothetical protein